MQIVNKTTTYADTNWASDSVDRASSNGGSIILQTQSLIALLPAYSELDGNVNATSEALWVRSVLQDLGKRFAIELVSDASAVFGIFWRQGPGRVMHVDSKFWYVQEPNVEKELAFIKVPGQRTRPISARNHSVPLQC